MAVCAVNAQELLSALRENVYGPALASLQCQLHMLSKRLIKKLISIVGQEGVLTSTEECLVYECDGLTVFRAPPEAVVLPTSTDQVSMVVKMCNDEKVTFLPRGAGTGLSGGAISLKGGIIIGLNRMNRIFGVDLQNQRAVVEAGVVNLWVSKAVARAGFYYAPDPASQQACTIGGNIAHNSGGVHTLKYGVTTNHVLGLELVLPSGEVVQVGGKVLEMPGYDLTGVVVGSEGTLGVVTKAVLRLSRKVEAVKTFLAVFKSVKDASNAVSGIIGEGIIPAAIEMMDALSIRAVEASIHAAGFPQDSAALLLIEIDGLRDGLEVLAKRVLDVCHRNYAREVREARDEEERRRWWDGRKQAFGAMGRVSPTYLVEDGVIPRTKLPEVLKRVEEIGRRYGFTVANVFHAGDGNLHPLIPFDDRKEGERDRALKAGEEILRVCVEVGGSLSGEHGIGIIKREQVPFLFNEDDIHAMKMLKDAFDPEGLCNPGKLFPSQGPCGEAPRVQTLPVVGGW